VKHESQKDKTKDSRHKNRYETQGKINQFNQSINLFSQLCNNKNECQQNNVTGYRKSKSLISAGRPNKYKILHKKG